MTLSMYSLAVPTVRGMLNNLDHMLDKAQAFVDVKKCDPTALTGYRLAPDMLNFTKQIQIACDTAKKGIARLAGVDAPVFEDTEQTLAELKQRIAKTLDFVATVPAAQIDGTEQKEITFPAGPTTRTMLGEDYLKHWMIPNLYFHITTAYVILRHNGVELGKRDFLVGSGT